MSKQTIQNAIGVIEYLAKRVEEEIVNSSTENGITEDELVLEDANNVLNELYNLVEEEM